MDENNILNLDAVLGKPKLKVVFQGNEYFLKSYEDLTPEEFMEVMALGEKFTGFTNIKGSDMPNEILKSVSRMMEIIAPELTAAGIPFNGQMNVLTFWKDQQATKAKKKTARASK